MYCTTVLDIKLLNVVERCKISRQSGEVLQQQNYITLDYRGNFTTVVTCALTIKQFAGLNNLVKLSLEYVAINATLKGSNEIFDLQFFS